MVIAPEANWFDRAGRIVYVKHTTSPLMTHSSRNIFWPVLCLSLACLPARLCGQVAISFDYSLDTGGFFTDSSRKTLLQSAANSITSRLADTLDAITPGGGNTWGAVIINPTTGTSTTLTDTTIPANTLVIYVGGRDLPGSVLGQGGPGGFTATGFAPFLTTLQTRGEIGAPTTEFGPWGGSIAFDNATSWYFDSDPSTSDVPGGQVDFYSVALHELGHVLGIGLAGSWTGKISGTDFTGANSKAAHNGVNVPLETDGGHWLNGTLSVLPGTVISQEAAMDPSITIGGRKLFTELDYAGLSDIGWSVVPEPAAVSLVAGAGLLAFTGLRRRLGRQG